jgi:SAM-dependent methyltransferase
MTPGSSAPPPLTPMACLRYDVIARRLAEIRPGSVLEIGCGQGAVGARLARQASYLGVEPDALSYQTAAVRITAAGGELIKGDDRAVPGGRSFDLVCAFEVLEHLEDDKAALTDWARFVRPGGYLLVSVPAWPQRFGPMDEMVGHFRRYTPAELEGRLLDAGLAEPAVTLYGWPLGYALEALRNRVAAGRRQLVAETPVTDRTAGSGRLFQPRRMIGLSVEAAVFPFRYMQRVSPGRGTGIVATARRPA